MSNELDRAYEIIAKLTAELNALAPVVHSAAATARANVADLSDFAERGTVPTQAQIARMLPRNQRLADDAIAALRDTGRIA